MPKGKAPHIKAAIAPNWLMSKVEMVRFVLLSKSNLCASLRKKLEVLNTKAEEVYGNARRACMVLKNRDKLFLETQIELENNVAKVVVEEKKACSLKVKMDNTIRKCVLIHSRFH